MTFKTTCFTLEDAVEALIDYRGKTPKKTLSGVPLITAKVIKNGEILEPTEFIAVENYDSWMVRGLPKVGDVVLTVEAPLGQVAQLEDSYVALAQRVVTLRGKKGVLDNTYLKYLLMTPKMQAALDGRSSGSTVKGIKQSELRKVELDLPEYNLQKEIADVLASLDAKITVNKAMNQTLEKIAQRIFKSWFIDYDPVKANKEGVAFDGLSPKIQALFPNEFEDSELGMKPKGWDFKQISDVADVTKGKSYKSSELTSSDVALVTLKSFQRGGGYRLDGYKEYVGKFKESQVVENGDLIIAYTDMTQAADVIGKPAMVTGNRKYKTLVISLDVGVITPKIEYAKNYLYALAKTDRFINHTKSYTSGTTVLHLGKDAVPSFTFVQPSDEILQKYHELTSSIFERISENIIQSDILNSLRDRLLPKLISGQITVGEAQKELAEAI